MIRAAAALVALAGGAPIAAAGVVSGLVYIDEDGSGTPGPGEPGVAGVAVYWETDLRVVTDELGRFSIQVPDRDGMIWARVPGGFSPSPVWQAIAGGQGEADLGLTPMAIGRPAFIHASDTHMGKKELGLDRRFSSTDLIDAMQQAIDPDDPPMFFAITGDIAAGTEQEHYDAILEAKSQITIPFVPVPGNHDWYDGGDAYRANLGPPMYSFSAGGARFVVLNDNGDTAAWQRFLALDLADATENQVIAFIHQPPPDADLDTLAAAGVDVLLSGHWHSNMVIERGGLIELNTQPLYSGGIDTTPGGYRIIELVAGGIDVRHHNVVNRGHARIVYPRGTVCGPVTEILAAIEMGAGDLEVRATIDGRTVPLEPAGGWVYRAALEGPAGGGTIQLRARRGVDELAESVDWQPVTCAEPEVLGEWPQLQGNPGHTGYTSRPIAPPLAPLWTTAVGGHVHGGSPVVAGGRVFVSVSDFAAGDGGLVALDLMTGAELWRRKTGASVRNAAAVAGDVVVIGRADGVVEGLEVESGELRWSVDLGEGLTANQSVLHAAPAVADGVIYIGVHRRFAAIDASTGEVLWQRDPADGLTLSSLAAAAVGDEIVVGTVARGESGLFVWARDSPGLFAGFAGLTRERWRTSASTAIGAHASPVIDGDSVYVANAMGAVVALDITSADEHWRAPIIAAGEWDYGIVATPALSAGKLFVPTQYDRLAALDTSDGSIVWTLEVAESPLRPSHTRTVTGAVGASPVVSGDVLWVGASDGVLLALDPSTGDELWRADLGSPITSGAAPAGDLLIVATYDGTVRAMMPVPTEVAEEEPSSGCACTTTGSGGALALFFLAVWFLRQQSRRSR